MDVPACALIMQQTARFPLIRSPNGSHHIERLERRGV
jgi:hypothetical protein